EVIKTPKLGTCLQRHRLDHTDPVVSVQFTARELRDHFKDLIRESADIENVLTLNSLYRAIRPHVDTSQTSVRIALLERIPLSHGCRAATSAGINPRLVIRNKDHEIALRLAAVEQCQRSATVGSTSTNRRQLGGVGHHAVTRVQANLHHVTLERQHFNARVLAQYCCRNESRDIDTTHGCGCALSVAGYRRR